MELNVKMLRLITMQQVRTAGPFDTAGFDFIDLCTQFVGSLDAINRRGVVAD